MIDERLSHVYDGNGTCVYCGLDGASHSRNLQMLINQGYEHNGDFCEQRTIEFKRRLIEFNLKPAIHISE